MKKSKLAKLVTSVNILGQDIDIEYKPNVIADDGEECLGLARMGENTIEIADNPRIRYDSKLSTLTHEIFEHINSMLELDLEHSQISSLETAVYYVFRHNPDLCKAFTLYLGQKEE